MRPTDTEIARLLARASWLVQGMGEMSRDERDTMAQEMRSVAMTLFPATAPASYETTPTQTLHGNWTGD